MIYPETHQGYNKLADLDRSFVGTSDYMGLVYFWNHAYRHYLRGASCGKRKLVHDRLIRAGLKLSDVSAEHTSIIEHVTGA